MTSRHALFACLASLALVSPAAAEPAAPEAVAATPIAVTKPPAGKIDNLFAVAPLPTGFLLTWARSAGSVPPFTLYAQKYTATGAPSGAAAVVDGPGVVGDIVVPRVLANGKVALFWMRGGHVWAAKLDPATMAVTSKTDLGRTDDHIHDATVLSNGNIALITAQIDRSNINDLRYKNSVKIVDGNFRTVKNWASIHGSGFKLDGWAYLDQAIVAHTTGSLALYRDHATNKIMGRYVSNAGTQAASPMQINTTAMTAPSVLDLAYFQIKGARLTSGKLAVCWVSLEAAGTKRYEVRCRMATATGVPTGKDFLVHTSTDGGQTAPDVVALPGDRFLVTWVHSDTIFPAHVRYRAFTAAGLPVNVQRTGYSFTAKDLTMAPLNTEAVRLGDGSVAVVMDQSAFVPGLRGFGIAKPMN